MKKLLFSLLLLLCVTAGWAGPLPGGGYSAATLSELQAAINSSLSDNTSNAKILLTADIDISGLQSPLCSKFTGSIDGTYTVEKDGVTTTLSHALYAGGDKERKRTSHLFDDVENAVFRNVAFSHIRVDDSSNSELGVIARRVKGTLFEAVDMDSCSVFCDKDRAGSMAGYAEHCEFKAVRIYNCDVTIDGVEAGGVVGHSNTCVFDFVTTSLGSSVFADGNYWGGSQAWSGGLVGYSKYDKFYDCITGGLVGADENYVGGMTGESVGSDFSGCINLGTVVHTGESDFSDMCNERRSLLASYDPASAGMLAGIGTLATEAAIIVGLLTSKTVLASLATLDGIIYSALFHGGATAIHLGTGGTMLFWSSSLAVIAGAAAIVIAVVAVAVAITVWVAMGDDEVGGISGIARGGIFDQCQNYGSLKCKDHNCGGIVGRGLGVTINNCFNSGAFNFNQKTTTGAILGAAEPNPDDNNKKCKVTNCLSSWAFHIVGDKDIEDGLDPASGNNYRTSRSDVATIDWEMVVDSRNVLDGQVAYWLNQGYENRIKGIKPWHLSSQTSIDKHVVLDPSQPEVTIRNLSPMYISTPQDLITYAERVKEDQFKSAILDSDIDMTGYPWTPIGQDGFTTNFRGVFDGQGHTIRGLKCTSGDAVGLFGTVHTGAEIRNVIIGEDCEFTGTGNSGAGAIVGEVPIGWKWGNVVIENCVNYGKVTAQNNVNAGGILGLVRNNTNDNVHIFVNNCGNLGTVTAENGNSGLIGGYMRNSGIVTNCWSAGQLRTSTEGVKPYDDTQGHSEFFVGYMDKLDIKNCYVIEKEDNVDGATVGSRQAGVEGYTEKALTSGHLAYLLNGSTNDVSQPLVWEQYLGVDEVPVLGNKGIYYTREVFNAIGTICLPYVLKSDEDITYYTFSESSTDGGEIKLNFVSADTIAAGTPALFKANSPTGVLTFSGAGQGWANLPANPETGSWKLLGTYDRLDINDVYDIKRTYYISGGKVKHATNAVVINPYRAYFYGPRYDALTGNGANARISIMLDGEEDETSALELVYDYENDNENERRSYTLFGTEAGEGYRGITVKNGKKELR